MLLQILMLSSTSDPIPWVDCSSMGPPDITQLQPFATIASISCALRLNLMQHYAFETIARHLLHHLTSDIIKEDNAYAHDRHQNEPLKHQLIAYIGGAAGAGKSAIISGILTFARLWGRRNTVETMSFTGLAGLFVEGDTLHHKRGLTIALTRCDQTAVNTLVGSVYLTIIDEISMMPQKVLGGGDEVTREIKCSNEPWGGNDIVMCGDWLQLPPVKAQPIYEQLKENHNDHRSYAAYNLWQAINFVVFLTDVMRQRDDLPFRDILSRTHYGVNTEEDLEILNTRTVHECYQTDVTPIVMPTDPQNQFYFSPMVTPLNKDRCAYLKVHNLNHAKKSLIPLYEVMAEPADEKHNKSMRQLALLDDDCTDKIPILFSGYLGMPIMITKRYKKDYKVIEMLKLIANGTLAFLVGFTPDTTNGKTNEDIYETRYVDSVEVKRFKLMPKLIWIQIRGINRVLSPGYPPGVVGLPPLKLSAKIQLPGRTFNLTLTQFPMLSANALTTEKLQGITLGHHLFIGRLDRSGYVPQSFYVALSRVLALKWLVFSERLEMDYVRKFTPPLHALLETKKLMMKTDLPSYMTQVQLRDYEAWRLLELQYCSEAIDIARSKKKGRRMSTDTNLQTPPASVLLPSSTILIPEHAIIDLGFCYTFEQALSHGGLNSQDMIDNCLSESLRCFFIHIG